MGSFYGNSSLSEGVSEEEMENMIQISAEELKNHIIVSKTQPTVQKEGDLWFVVVSDNN